VAFLGALTAYIVLPHHLNEFDIVTFFPRFAPLVLLMALLVIPRGLRRYTRASLLIGTLLAIPAVVFGIVWGRELLRHWRLYADETADFRVVMGVTKPNHRLFGMPFERRSRVLRVESAMIGMGHFYPVLKPGPKSMVPLMYCDMLHMPCVRRSPLEALPDPSPWLPGQLDPDKGVPFYDYFLVRALPPGRDLFGKRKGEVELLVHKGAWWLYQRKGLR
jgi:hypothetical protein